MPGEGGFPRPPRSVRVGEMSAADDSCPEPLVDRPADATAEVTPLPPLPPEDAHRVTTEIRAVAESRGEPSEDFDLARPPEGPGDGADGADGAAGTAAAAPDDEQLTADELRDAWPLLDLEE